MKFKLIHYSPLEKEVVSLFKTNLTQAEISKKLGIGKTSVGNIVKKLGLKRSPRFKYKGYDKRKIEFLERLGLSHIEIAGVFGVLITTLKRIYNHFGKDFSTPENPIRTQKRVQSRRFNQLNGMRPDCPNQINILEKYADEIIGLLQTGVSKAEIARRYNVCPATVSYHLKKLEVSNA